MYFATLMEKHVCIASSGTTSASCARDNRPRHRGARRLRALEVRRKLGGVDIAGHYDPSFPHLDAPSSKVPTLRGVQRAVIFSSDGTRRDGMIRRLFVLSAALIVIV